MSQVIDDGVSKVVVAVAVIVISAIICGVGGMAVSAFFGMRDIQSHIESIDKHLDSIDRQLYGSAKDRGNYVGRDGP